MESKKIEGIGQVARTTHEKRIQHVVGYSQDKTQKKETYTWIKKKVLQKEDLGILTGFS
jgi:hypothetical protein